MSAFRPTASKQEICKPPQKQCLQIRPLCIRWIHGERTGASRMNAYIQINMEIQIFPEFAAQLIFSLLDWQKGFIDLTSSFILYWSSSLERLGSPFPESKGSAETRYSTIGLNNRPSPYWLDEANIAKYAQLVLWIESRSGNFVSLIWGIGRRWKRFLKDQDRRLLNCELTQIS